MFDEAAAVNVRSLLDRDMLGAGAFETDDCKKTYEELKAKGVEFVSPPRQQFYGIEAVFKDGSEIGLASLQRLNK